MVATDVLVLMAGFLLLAVLGLLLWGWRRNAVRSVIPPDRRPGVLSTREPADTRLPHVRGRLLWLLAQRGSLPPLAGPTPLAPEVIDQARALLARRHKIEAIKLIRERTGWGLKESKDFVDGLR